MARKSNAAANEGERGGVDGLASKREPVTDSPHLHQKKFKVTVRWPCFFERKKIVQGSLLPIRLLKTERILVSVDFSFQQRIEGYQVLLCFLPMHFDVLRRCSRIFCQVVFTCCPCPYISAIHEFLAWKSKNGTIQFCEGDREFGFIWVSFEFVVQFRPTNFKFCNLARIKL